MEFVGPGTTTSRHDRNRSGRGPASDAKLCARLLREAAATRALEQTIAYNMLVPPHIRAAHLSRPPSDGAVLPTIDVPVLVTQAMKTCWCRRALGS